MLPFHQVVRDDFEAVNRLILAELRSDEPLVEQIGHYIVDAGGKRLRPLVVLLAARALGYRGDRHVALAAVIEFIHTATLLHDDVVDTSQRRRGRPTANARFGNAPSVLVGDFLYSRAFQLLVSLGDLEIMRILADTTNAIAEGEVAQLARAGCETPEADDYFRVIDKKTARLFRAAAEAAAVLAGSDHCRQPLARYGHHLGMVFQLVDDLLDYEGDAAALGKNLGDDLAEGKATLPLIHVLETGTADQVELVRGALRNRSAECFAEVMAAIRATGALERTRAVARHHLEAATAALAPLPAGREREALRAVAEFAFSRDH
ncbi:MAG: octaprenyl-diphosphate synthase [Porticoccaceae bacterium]|nr:MAG: octaprenyl-diphosphate synthase [Porticoccaceae bacterium]